MYFIVRLVAFVMRAYIAGSNSAQHNQSLITAESIIYSIGFFGILESAYTLTIDRSVELRYGPMKILTRTFTEKLLAAEQTTIHLRKYQQTPV